MEKLSPPPQRAQANGHLRVGPVAPAPLTHKAHAWGMGRFRTLVTKLCSTASQVQKHWGGMEKRNQSQERQILG